MPPEVIENSSQPPSKSNKNPLVAILLIALILLAAGLIYLGRQYGPPAPSSVEGPTGLTDAQKAEILKSLQLPPGTPPLSQVQKEAIVKSLQLPPNTPPLSEAQKAEILKSLR